MTTATAKTVISPRQGFLTPPMGYTGHLCHDE